MIKLVKTGREIWEKSDYIFSIVTTLSLIILWVASVYVLKYTDGAKSYEGVIKYRYEDNLKDRVDRKFTVKLDSIDEPVDILVKPNLYFSSKVGDRVSFKMSKRDLNLIPGWGMAGLVLILTALVINHILFIIVIVIVFNFLTSNYKWIKIQKINNHYGLDPYGEEDWYN